MSSKHNTRWLKRSFVHSIFGGFVYLETFGRCEGIFPVGTSRPVRYRSHFPTTGVGHDPWSSCPWFLRNSPSKRVLLNSLFLVPSRVTHDSTSSFSLFLSFPPFLCLCLFHLWQSSVPFTDNDGRSSKEKPTFLCMGDCTFFRLVEVCQISLTPFCGPGHPSWWVSGLFPSTNDSPPSWLVHGALVLVVVGPLPSVPFSFPITTRSLGRRQSGISS